MQQNYTRRFMRNKQKIMVQNVKKIPKKQKAYAQWLFKRIDPLN